MRRGCALLVLVCCPGAESPRELALTAARALDDPADRALLVAECAVLHDFLGIAAGRLARREP